LIGSADQILADLRTRASGAGEAEREKIARDAQRCGDYAYAVFKWSLAINFYELVIELSPSRRTEDLACRLAECIRRSRPLLDEESAIIEAAFELRPMADMRRLPEVWLNLAYSYTCKEYFLRAAKAAEAINDHALAVWAGRKVERSGPGTSSRRCHAG
jgi:hypothetical protein